MKQYNTATSARAALQAHLFAAQDSAYGDFHSGLVPNVPRNRIIGVRMPRMRQIAKALASGKLTGDKTDSAAPPLRWQDYFDQVETAWLRQAPDGAAAPGSAVTDSAAGHVVYDTVSTATDGIMEEQPLYYEEILIAGLALSYAKLPLDERFAWIARFVPLMDNWAVCDTFCGTWKPKEAELPLLWNFLKSRYLTELHGSAKEYDLRYGVVMLLSHFVMREDYIDWVLSICNEIDHPAYYVKMAVAWALSYAFIFFPEKTIALFQSPDNKLDDFTYNKSIQKACESFRVPKETKDFLRSMRR